MRWPWHPRSNSDDRRFGFAVVGLGHGATKFLKALHDSPTVRVAALVSRDKIKANKLARTHGVPAVYRYDNFDRLAQDPQVDAVYLCLPNALHREFTERAARAGKHVLCEKPMASSVDDCQHMIQACEEANRLLMMGYRLSFTSVHTKARELLASGVLGEVRSVRSGFGFRAAPGWRLDPALAGGGSLFDVGIYAVNTLYTLLNQEFAVADADFTRAPLTGLELAADWRGHLSNGAPIHGSSSYLAKIPDFFEVQTARATLTLKPAFRYEGLHLRVRAHAAADRRELDLDLSAGRGEPSAFRLEAEHLALSATTGAPLRTPGEHGLRDLKVLAHIERIATSRALPQG